MNLYQTILLTFLIVAATASWKNTTDFWMKQLGVQSLSYECISGYEEIDWYHDKGTTGMYYSLFGAYGHSIKVQDSRVPLIIWLQGGPGASSQFGAFTEIGPIRIMEGKAKQFEQSWNIIGHTVFIDQPLGVGFSWQKSRSMVSSAREAGDHLLNFLSNLYATWPALRKSPLYLTGQSYAGHYLPAFANRILNNNTFIKANNMTLEGVAIGDGWTDPINQINFYDSYLYSVGVASNKFRDTCTWFQTNAMQNINFADYRNATQYFDFLTNNEETRTNYWGGMSTYNFRHYGDEDSTFAKVLNESLSDLGIPAGQYYIPGNDDIYDAFQKDITRSYAGDVINLLKKVRVLIYNGQDDFVVNTAGVLNYLNSLNWQGTPMWKRTQKVIWTIHGKINGWAKVYQNLWFVLVNHAGHMVPTDQPEAAFNMFGHFVFDNKEWRQ